MRFIRNLLDVEFLWLGVAACYREGETPCVVGCGQCHMCGSLVMHVAEFQKQSVSDTSYLLPFVLSFLVVSVMWV